MSHGRYSETTRTALKRTVSNYFHTHGPPSERTRSRIQTRPGLPFQAPNTHLSTPSTGTFARNRSLTRSAQPRAQHRLRASRIRLRRYLTSTRWEPEFEDLDLRAPSRWLIDQLGTAEGSISALPQPPLATWDSEARMRSRRMRRCGRCSELRQVMISYGEKELDDLFGVLPGENWMGQGDLDWWAEAEVDERKIVDGRVLERIRNGEVVDGVWRDVVPNDFRNGATEVVARWAVERAWRWRRSVMDPRCVRVVGRVVKWR